MSKKGIIAAVKSVFVVSASSKSQETLRTGLIFGFVIAVMSLLLMLTGILDIIDTYVNAMVVQIGFQPPEQHDRVCIVKKDQATSELLGKNPDREEFASMFRFLGSNQIVKRQEGFSGTGQQILNINIGYFRGVKDLLFKSGYDEWGSFSDRSNLATATSVAAFDQAKWHSSSRQVREYFKNNPHETGFSSFIKVESQLWNPLRNNAFVALAGGGKFLVLPTFATNWQNPELIQYLQELLEKREQRKETEKTEKAAAKEVPKSIAEAVDLLKRWQNLFANLGRVSPDLHIGMFERPGVLINITLQMTLEPPPAEFLVEPASLIGFDFVLQGEKTSDADALLEKAIESSQSHVVLAGHTILEEDLRDVSQEEIASDSASFITRHTERVLRQIMPHPKFVKKNAEVAMIDMSVGSKSFVTMAPLFLFNKQSRQLMPSFSLKIAMLELDRRHPEMKPSYSEKMEQVLAENYEKVASGTFLGPLVIHDRQIPVNSKGMMLIDFVGSTSRSRFRNAAIGSVSFYECFDRKTLRRLRRKMPGKKELTPEHAYTRTLGSGLKSVNKSGRIMLAGPFEVSDFDYFPTPLDLYTPYRIQREPLMGIELHANAIINILDKRYIAHPNGNYTAVVLFLSCLLLGFLLDILSPVAGAFLTFAFMGSTLWHAYSSYHVARQIFICSPLLVSFPAIWSVATLTNYVRQRIRAQKTKDMFSRFVAADVVQYMLNNPELVKPGGEKVELTIFFSDVAGFTSISEALTPEELVVLLNEYLGAMTDLLFEYGGTLDKFIGDAVMAFWNFPRKQDDHAVRGCLCALAMQRKINELQIGWAERGLPRVSARAGLNTANVVVGYMGSSKAQMNFTCMGDGVNLASRLEGANKEYGTAMMVSDATYQRVKHVIAGRFLDFLAVKGKKEPVKVFELVSEIGKEPHGWNELAAMYDHAIQLHLDRQWDEAIATFEQLLTRWPDDGPSKTYITRCNEYKLNPPPEGWDGRYILTHK